MITVEGASLAGHVFLGSCLLVVLVLAIVVVVVGIRQALTSDVGIVDE